MCLAWALQTFDNRLLGSVRAPNLALLSSRRRVVVTQCILLIETIVHFPSAAGKTHEAGKGRHPRDDCEISADDAAKSADDVGAGRPERHSQVQGRLLGLHGRGESVHQPDRRHRLGHQAAADRPLEQLRERHPADRVAVLERFRRVQRASGERQPKHITIRHGVAAGAPAVGRAAAGAGRQQQREPHTDGRPAADPVPAAHRRAGPRDAEQQQLAVLSDQRVRRRHREPLESGVARHDDHVAAHRQRLQQREQGERKASVDRHQSAAQSGLVNVQRRRFALAHRPPAVADVHAAAAVGTELPQRISDATERRLDHDDAERGAEPTRLDRIDGDAAAATSHVHH